MKLGPYHLRKDGCWREVPQVLTQDQIDLVSALGGDRRKLTVLRLLFEWPWQKKDPMLDAELQKFDDCKKAQKEYFDTPDDIGRL